MKLGTVALDGPQIHRRTRRAGCLLPPCSWLTSALQPTYSGRSKPRPYVASTTLSADFNTKSNW